MLRPAGKALKWLFSNYDEASGGLKTMTALELAGRLGPDVLFSGISAATTPGDIGDKLIAGSAATLGGAAGGLALGKLGGPGVLGTALDFAGSMGGDMLASRVGEEVMKGKSAVMGEGYKTPYQKMSEEQQMQLAAAIRQDIMRQYGMVVPGAPVQYADPTTGMGVA